MFTVVLKAIWLTMFSTSVGFHTASVRNVSLKGELAPYVKVFNIETINGFLGQVKFLQTSKGPESFPAIGEERTWNDTGASIPLSIRTRFREMNRVVFGQDRVVQLVTADGDLTALHNAGRKIGFPRELLNMKAQSQILVDFTLAHALSHYLYELYIEKYSRNDLSPHGLPSRKDHGSLSESALSAAAHAEVDAIAVAIMLKMGHDPKSLQAVLSDDFLRAKNLVDDSVGMDINEMTSFRAIPPDFKARVRDNYVRLVSLIYTLYTWRQRQEQGDSDRAQL